MSLLLFGAVVAATLVKSRRRTGSKDVATRLPDGTPHAQILFFHTSWCPACQKAEPAIRAITKRYPRIVFTHVDIEKDPQTASALTASAFLISSIPAFVALIDGKEVDRREGFKDATDLEYFVKDTFEGAIETGEKKALEA